MVLENLSLDIEVIEAKNHESPLFSLFDWHISLQNTLKRCTSDTHHFFAKKCLLKKKETQFLESQPAERSICSNVYINVPTPVH